MSYFGGWPRYVTVAERRAKARIEPTSASRQKSKPAKKKASRAGAKRKAWPRGAFNPKAPTGAAIARLRRQTEQTKVEFAKTLDVSTASVSRWETIRGRLRLNDCSIAALDALQEKIQRRKK